MSPEDELKTRRVLSMVLEGKKKYQSYMEVYPNLTEGTAKRKVYTMFQDPEVQELFELMKEEAASKLTMSRVGKREWLKRVRDVCVTDIDLDDPEKKNHDLIEKIMYRYDREGNKVSATIQLPSKLQALEMDNRMAGHNEAEKVEVELTGGVMMIPAGQSLDDWESQATGQQKKLKEVDYIDVDDVGTVEDETLC
jgi:L-rhamnose mutarotase